MDEKTKNWGVSEPADGVASDQVVVRNPEAGKEKQSDAAIMAAANLQSSHRACGQSSLEIDRASQVTPYTIAGGRGQCRTKLDLSMSKAQASDITEFWTTEFS